MKRISIYKWKLLGLKLKIMLLEDGLKFGTIYFNPAAYEALFLMYHAYNYAMVSFMLLS